MPEKLKKEIRKVALRKVREGKLPRERIDNYVYGTLANIEKRKNKSKA